MYEMDAPSASSAPAGFFRRAMAYLIDFFIVVLLWGLAFFVLVIVMLVFDPQEEDSDTYGSAFLIAVPILSFLYRWVGNSTGVSVGKKRMSLAVRCLSDGARPGIWRGLVRTLGQALGALPLGLGFWWALWDARRQAWHDKIAGTQVVHLARAPAVARAKSRTPKWMPPWMRSRYAKYFDPLALEKALQEPLPIDAASTPLDVSLTPGPRPLYTLWFLAGLVPLVVFRLVFGFALDLPTLLFIAGELLMVLAGGVELSGLNRNIQVSGDGIRLVKIYRTRTVPWLEIERVEAKPDLSLMRVVGKARRVSWDCRLIPVDKRKAIMIAIRARLPLGVPIEEWPKLGQLMAVTARSALTAGAMALFLAASFMGATAGAVRGPCAGDESNSCLRAQGELQSISRRDCAGTIRRVCLVALGQVRPDLVQNLVSEWSERGLPVTVLTPAALPGNIVNDGRGQVDAPTLIRYMDILFPDAYRDENAVLIGLTPADLYDKESHFRYVFGMKGTVTHPKAVISTFRMDPVTYCDSSDDELLFARAGKLFTRYVGLLYYGLPLNSDRSSPLYEDILGLKDLDNIEEDLPLPDTPVEREPDES